MSSQRRRSHHHVDMSQPPRFGKWLEIARLWVGVSVNIWHDNDDVALALIGEVKFNPNGMTGWLPASPWWGHALSNWSSNDGTSITLFHFLQMPLPAPVASRIVFQAFSGGLLCFSTHIFHNFNPHVHRSLVQEWRLLLGLNLEVLLLWWSTSAERRALSHSSSSTA